MDVDSCRPNTFPVVRATGSLWWFGLQFKGLFPVIELCGFCLAPLFSMETKFPQREKETNYDLTMLICEKRNPVGNAHEKYAWTLTALSALWAKAFTLRPGVRFPLFL